MVSKPSRTLSASQAEHCQHAAQSIVSEPNGSSSAGRAGRCQRAEWSIVSKTRRVPLANGAPSAEHRTERSNVSGASSRTEQQAERSTLSGASSRAEHRQRDERSTVSWPNIKPSGASSAERRHWNIGAERSTVSETSEVPTASRAGRCQRAERSIYTGASCRAEHGQQDEWHTVGK
jgi:hypothetical protein